MGRLDSADRVFLNNDITPHTYATMSEILSAKGDIKEERIIERMKNDGYTLIGQLNADGVHDDYVKKYIRYTGTEEGLRSRARNQKAVIQKITVQRNIVDEILGMKNGEELRYAENEEELKNGGILKNDGTAFIFVKTSEFEEVMEKMNQMEDIIKVGNFIPGTKDKITRVGTITNIQPGVRMVQVNDQKNWIPLDIKTGKRMMPEKGIDVMGILMGGAKSAAIGTLATKQVSTDEERVDNMVAILDDIAHRGMSVVDEILANLQELKR